MRGWAIASPLSITAGCRGWDGESDWLLQPEAIAIGQRIGVDCVGPPVFGSPAAPGSTQLSSSGGGKQEGRGINASGGLEQSDLDPPIHAPLGRAVGGSGQGDDLAQDLGHGRAGLGLIAHAGAGKLDIVADQGVRRLGAKVQDGPVGGDESDQLGDRLALPRGLAGE